MSKVLFKSRENRMKPIVSVICTVKNGEKFISQTIDSILDQTLSELELIIVDDGSSDGTSEIIKEYTKYDSRIKFVPTKGVGRARALNLAIKEAQGKYIANIDADDPCHPQRLEIEAKLLDSNREFALIATDTILIKDYVHYKELNWVVEYFPQNSTVIDVTRKLLKFNPISHSSIMIRKNALLQVGGYNENLKSNVDYDLWVRLASSKYKLGKIPLKLSSKRIHSAQSFENKKRIDYIINSSRVQIKAIKKLNAPIYYFIFPYIRLLYGLLPQSLRVNIRWISKKLNL